MRTIYIVDKSNYVTTDELKQAVKAIEKQLDDDYYPYWSRDITLRPIQEPSANSETICLVDDVTHADTLGYHTLDPNTFTPCGIVCIALALKYGVPWQSVLSHEVLEQAEDWDCEDIREVVWNGRPAWVRKEIADPVERDTYLIDGVPVSNFVTPYWFSQSPPGGARFDFLGRLTAPLTLGPGGYIPIAFSPRSWINLTSDAREVSAYRMAMFATEYSRTRKGKGKPQTV